MPSAAVQLSAHILGDNAFGPWWWGPQRLGALAVGALAAMRLLAAMLLSTAVGAALGVGGCDATIGDPVALDVLVRFSAHWCGFRRRHGPQRYSKQQWGPWSSAMQRVPNNLDLTFRDDFILYLSKHY